LKIDVYFEYVHKDGFCRSTFIVVDVQEADYNKHLNVEIYLKMEIVLRLKISRIRSSGQNLKNLPISF